ncbi:hypothetical protein KCU78_g1234, partial [Aureobasidium melanogenum]
MKLIIFFNVVLSGITLGLATETTAADDPPNGVPLCVNGDVGKYPPFTIMKDCMTHCFGTETAPGPNFQHVCTGYCDVTPYCSDTGGGCNVVTICFGSP